MITERDLNNEIAFQLMSPRRHLFKQIARSLANTRYLGYRRLAMLIILKRREME